MMKNNKVSEIAWISIGDKIKKEWKINACKKEEKKEDKKDIDYKSIALPAELQGLNEFVLIIFQLINTFLYSLNGEKQ
jgi:hypothetical protein